MRRDKLETGLLVLLVN